MAFTNEDLARQFAEIAALLQLTGADRFRVRAYERAADAIAGANVDLADLNEDEIAQLKGIGTSTARKVDELRRTGEIAMLTKLREQVSPGLLQLVRIPGLGPKTAKRLFEELGVDSIEALESAIAGRRVRSLPGLGPKAEANLAESIRRMGAKQDGRVPVADALGVAHQLSAQLRVVPGVERVAVAGSLRRLRETIGDIDLLVAAVPGAPAMDALSRSHLVAKVLAAGERKTSVLTVRGLQVDVRVVEPEAWGAALVYFTGSKAHNIRIRERAVRRGLTLNEYGLVDKTSGERVAGRTEEDVYAALGLAVIPAPMREDTGEVEAAADGTLPSVVTVDDIRGDLHGHTDWSGDGRASLTEMLDAAAERGWTYWAVTDHAENLTMNGISRAAMLAQRDEIARLQERYPDLEILHGAELNIDIDGGVDYDEDFLAGYDFTVASVHSLMRRPAAEQTARIIAAMANPAVNVIGHLTGRKIGIRPGYEVDFDDIADAAVDTGTALEVNASPARLDCSGDLVRRAVAKGVTVAISCDAHRVGDLDNMPYGVATAQRGWATPADVLNCRRIDGLRTFVAAKRA